MAVIALPDEFEVESKATHLQRLRPCQGEAAGGGVRRVVDVERFAAAVARGDTFDLERQHVGNHGRTLQPFEAELYRLVNDAAEIADQVFTDEGGRAPGLP